MQIILKDLGDCKIEDVKTVTGASAHRRIISIYLVLPESIKLKDSVKYVKHPIKGNIFEIDINGNIKQKGDKT